MGSSIDTMLEPFDKALACSSPTSEEQKSTCYAGGDKKVIPQKPPFDVK